MELELATLEDILLELDKRYECLVLGVYGTYEDNQKLNLIKYRYKGGYLACVGLAAHLQNCILQSVDKPSGNPTDFTAD